MENLRLFFALNLSSAVVSRLAAAVMEMRERLPKVQWVRREALHLTVHFFGTTSATDIPGIARIAVKATSGWNPFSLKATGVGSFPSGRRPSVLWAGIDEGASQLRSWVEVLRTALSDAGYPVEDRPFVPHITLGRFRRDCPVNRTDFEAVLTAYRAHEFGVSSIDRLVLYASDLRPTGAVYTVVDQWPFA